MGALNPFDQLPAHLLLTAGETEGQALVEGGLQRALGRERGAGVRASIARRWPKIVCRTKASSKAM